MGDENEVNMNQQLPQFIHRVVDRLQSIEGIAAIALGGSRARGNHTQKSDVDLGIYYQPENPLDLVALNHLASQLDDKHRANLITPIGEWGKWINGGGWLKVEGVSVDFLYRDVLQVSHVMDDCHAGQITIDYQPGHPHGFVSSIYMGEVAIGLPLHDPDGVLAALKAKTTPYPITLKQATVNKFAWEISFSLFVAQKAVARGDVAYAAGCCFRSVACMNQVLFALNQEYLLNEKGAVALANNFALCPPDYQQRVESAFALLAADATSIMDAIAILEEIEQDLSQWYGDRRLAM
jgi:predicted nucleotidyltransferase